MKTTLRLIIGLALLAGITLSAQTPATNSPTPPAVFASSGVTLPDWINLTVNAVENSSILQATNYAVALYGTYAPSAATKEGGGVLAVYNIPSLTSVSTNGAMGVGMALGFDWLGGWSLVSGNVTVKADTHPLAHLGVLSFLPDTIKNVTATPIAIAGIGQPMGSGSVGAATLWDIGYGVRFGHWLGGQFGAGFTWGEWMNAGTASGHRYHIFINWSTGLPHS